MELIVDQMDAGIKKLSLRGKMDIGGTDQIALRLSTETAIENARVILDLAELEFIGSLGIGILVKSYKALKLRGGKMVLLDPQELVELVLVKTQVHTLIPIYHDLKQAIDGVLQTMTSE